MNNEDGHSNCYNIQYETEGIESKHTEIVLTI